MYHLAAQAGVRHSIKKPDDYLTNNLIGFFNLPDISRIYKVKHFIFASTSSVYGYNKKLPFEEKDPKSSIPILCSNKTFKWINGPLLQLYLWNEMYRRKIFYSIWSLEDLIWHCLNLRKILFPKDPLIFTIMKHLRDFSYIDDVVNSLKLLKNKFLEKINFDSDNPSESLTTFQLLNIGNETKVNLWIILRRLKKSWHSF